MDAYSQAFSIIQISSRKAIETITALLNEEDPRIRLNAADKIHALKGTEYLGFEERLQDLECFIEKAQNQELS